MMCGLTFGTIYILWGFNILQAMAVIAAWELVKYLWRQIGA